MVLRCPYLPLFLAGFFFSKICLETPHCCAKIVLLRAVCLIPESGRPCYKFKPSNLVGARSARKLIGQANFSHLKEDNFLKIFFLPLQVFFTEPIKVGRYFKHIQPSKVFSAVLVGGLSYGMVLILGSNTLSVRKQVHFISAWKLSSTTSILQKEKFLIVD